jgi:hypothetical protein
MNAPRQPGALLRHPLAMAGAVIATTAAVVFIALLIAALAGLFTSQYAGLVVFVAIPALFVLGLVLMPAGMWLQRRWLRRHPDAPSDWPIIDFRDSRIRRMTLALVALAAVNVTVMLVAGYASLHWMESPGFCGQTCHTPMHVQFMAWQNGAHARIDCAMCHVGPGARGFMSAKLNGVHQLIAVTTGSFGRPIPPGAQVPFGGHNLTCGRCHQATRVPGDVVRIIRTYGDDEKNTESLTVLLMHVGRGSPGGHWIHWHADSNTRVEYAATDRTRQTIPYVRVTRPTGEVKEFFADGTKAEPPAQDDLRSMDCVDCHNMVGHRIASTPEQAVDQAFAASEATRQLPFARRESVKLLKASYSSDDEAMRMIDRGLRTFYESQGHTVDQAAVSRTVEALQSAYHHNLFPVMKVTWGTYPDNTGHTASPGCFRCHDGSHTAKDGSTISADCELCHKQVERPAS